MRQFRCLKICAVFALALACSPPAMGLTVYFSTSQEISVGGSSYSPGDIIQYDPGTATAGLYFDHNLFRSKNGQTGYPTNVDAFHVINANTFLLSTSDTTYLGSSVTKMSDADIVRYDKAADSAEVLYGETSLFWAKDNKKWKSTTTADIDALCALADGSYLLSTQESARIGSNHLYINPDDIAQYDPTTDTASLFLRGADVFVDSRGTGGDQVVNIDGLSCDENTGLIYFSVAGSTYVKDESNDAIAVSKGDIVAYDSSTGRSTIFLSFDELVNKWCGTENIDGLCIVGMTSNIPPPQTIPEPLTVGAFSLAVAMMGAYVRRRSWGRKA